MERGEDYQKEIERNDKGKTGIRKGDECFEWQSEETAGRDA